MDDRPIRVVTDEIQRRLAAIGIVRACGEAFDVRIHSHDRISLTLVGARTSPVQLDRLDGLPAYTTQQTTIDRAALQRLQSLAGTQRRPGLGPRGVRVAGRLVWDAITFRPQLRLAERCASEEEPIRQCLLESDRRATATGCLPRWPLRVLVLGRTSTDAYRDLRSASHLQCIKFAAMEAPIMGRNVVSRLCQYLADVKPEDADVVVVTGAAAMRPRCCPSATAG